MPADKPIRIGISRIVEPILNPIRRFVKPFNGIDFSPVVAILVVNLIEWLLIRLLSWLVLCHLSYIDLATIPGRSPDPFWQPQKSVGQNKSWFLYSWEQNLYGSKIHKYTHLIVSVSRVFKSLWTWCDTPGNPDNDFPFRARPRECLLRNIHIIELKYKPKFSVFQWKKPIFCPVVR